MCIYCDYCVYHYKSTELVSLYTLDIGLKINIIIIITVQGINCINFDNFRATQRFVHGHNPAYIMHVAAPVLYSDPSVHSLLPNDVVGPCITTTLHKN